MTTKLKLHMLLPPDAAGHQLTDPRDHLACTGPGGSRAGYMGLVRAMGRRGDYDVEAFSTFVRPREEIDGVTYRRLDDRRGMGEADVVFAYYDVRALVGMKTDGLRIGSHHTLHPYVAWPAIDVNTAPSRWAMDFLRRVYRPMSRWHVLPNAIEGVDHLEHHPVPGRVIYQTSPDRGLHVLLEQWGAIRARVPYATLHVTGSPEAIIRAYSRDEYRGSDEERMAQRLADGMLVAQRAGGVEFLGRVPRDVMLRELAQASCFAFPAELWSPSETFSVSILEAQRIGVPVVLCPQDALAEVWGESGCRMVPEPVREHMGEFVDAVVEVLTDAGVARRISEAQREFSKQFTFDAAAQVLDGIIREHLHIARARKEAA